MGGYTVCRHGGRGNNQWRVIYRSQQEEQARAKYFKAKEAMRQGGVRLLGPDGTLVRDDWAPRLRTRW